MSAARSVLTFEPAVVTFRWATSRSPLQREVRFLDPVVDGIALRTRVVDHGVTGVFGADLAAAADPVADRLMGLGTSDDLGFGRVELLVCQVCADVGCGSLTVALDVGDDEVVWLLPRWEDAGPDLLLDDRLGDTTFRFERAAYETAVRSAAIAVADLPVGEAPASPRHRWPGRRRR